MQERDYEEARGCFGKLFRDGLTESAKAIFEGLPEKVHALEDFDLTTANPSCERCNGTGIRRHVKTCGQLITIICNCVARPGTRIVAAETPNSEGFPDAERTERGQGV